MLSGKSSHGGALKANYDRTVKLTCKVKGGKMEVPVTASQGDHF